MINNKRFLLLMIILAPFCLAFDFQYTPFSKAIKSGDTAFVATVQSAAVVKKTVDRVIAQAELVVDECLYGSSCSNEKPVNLTYLAQASEGTSLSVNFPVGSQVIVVLNEKKGGSIYEFDSDVNGGTDFVYSCNSFPYQITDNGRQFKCRDMMTDKLTDWLNFNDIREDITAAGCTEK